MTDTPTTADPFVGHSPGPWTWEREQDEWPDHLLVDANGDPVLQWDMDLGFSFGRPADEALIAAAPALLHENTYLKACIAALEAERDRLREALWQIIDGATEYTRTECAIARAALEGGGDG